jgi:trimethylamine:corrinoid methyltransferase-like protein
MLLDYEPPNLDIEIDEKLIDFMNKRKESFKDMDY